MTVLSAVALVFGLFELLSAIWFNAPERAGQATAGIFALAFLACAWAMRARNSTVAAVVAGVLLVLEVGGIPFYERSSVTDWLIQAFVGVIGVVGIVAAVNVVRERRARRRSIAVRQTAP
jgi:peptidoglycan/LPS O-acetylase OafA/YrhL